MSFAMRKGQEFVELIGGFLGGEFYWNNGYRFSVLSLIARDHANRLSDDIEVEVFEIIVWGKREVLVDVVLVACVESCINI